MPEIQVFQCPSCGASLSYEGGPEPTIKCQFCGSDVIVPEALRAQAAPPPTTWSLPDLGLSPDKLEELEQLARTGQTIEAIKLYRQMFNAGLAQAKEAVEKLGTGEPLVMTSVTVSPSTAQAEQSAQMAEVVQLLRAGNKIEAIKLYRQVQDVGLKDAQDAIEAIEAGLAGSGQTAAPTPTRRAVKATGCGASLAGILLVVAILGFVLVMIWGLPFRLSGSYRQALDAARTNPAVIEALGAPVEASWLPISGNLSCGSSCSANYSIPIHGSRASGALIVMSDSEGAKLFNEGTWTLDATVRMDDGSTVTLKAPTPVPAMDNGSTATLKAPTPVSTPSAARLAATAEAAVRATTLAEFGAQATATAVAKTMSQAGQQATATTEAQATARAILATATVWPPNWTESFADNHRGWPVGPTQDEYILVTTAITNGKYLLTVSPKQDNSYLNLLPQDSQPLTDFNAAVNLRLVRGSDDGSYAYGLVFRHVNDDYGFFGLQNNGKFRMLVVYHTGIYQDITQRAAAIHTQPGQVNRIAVRAIGSDFLCLINDQVVWQLNEDMAPGDIGLGVDVRSKQAEAQVEFTDLQVRAP